MSKGTIINHFLDRLVEDFEGKEYVLLPTSFVGLDADVEPFGWAAECYITDSGSKSSEPCETPREGDKFILVARTLGLEPREIVIEAEAMNSRLEFGRPPIPKATLQKILPARNGPPSPTEGVWDISLLPNEERTEVIELSVATSILGNSRPVVSSKPPPMIFRFQCPG